MGEEDKTERPIGNAVAKQEVSNMPEEQMGRLYTALFTSPEKSVEAFYHFLRQEYLTKKGWVKQLDTKFDTDKNEIIEYELPNRVNTRGLIALPAFAHTLVSGHAETANYDKKTIEELECEYRDAIEKTVRTNLHEWQMNEADVPQIMFMLLFMARHSLSKTKEGGWTGRMTGSSSYSEVQTQNPTQDSNKIRGFLKKVTGS